MGAVALTGIDLFFIESEWLALRRVRVPIQGLHPDLSGYKIGVISDIHYPRNISPGFIRRASLMLSREEPDMIAVPGDFVDGRGSWTVPSLNGLFDDLSAPDGVVGTLGNHDHWLDGEGTEKEILDSTPIKLIENRHVLVERGGGALVVGGVGDLWEGKVAPDEAFAGVDPLVPRVLLSHNPDLAEEMMQDVRVDLQISGHTHGGEIVAPWGYGPIVPSKYGNKFRYGLNEGQSHMCFTTAGVCSPRHMRFSCRAEVVVLELVPLEV